MQTLGPAAASAVAAAASACIKKKARVGTLRVFGGDGRGIIAACVDVLGSHRANIVKSEHWTDTDAAGGLFFQRLAFEYDPVRLDRHSCQQELSERLLLVEQGRPSSSSSSYAPPPPLEAQWNWRDAPKRVGIMVSREGHCLWELLLRHSAKELDMDVRVVVSNHETLRPVAETFGIPYHVTEGGGGPFNNNNAENTRKSIEDEQLHLLLEWEVDVVVLARYMQVLSPRFLAHFPSSVINIHHSFLPAFEGGSPYRRAHERGVKLVGATAHYATAELDGGPIIEQDVHAVGHRDGVSDLIRKGRVLERNVLLRALEAHLDDRVIVCGNRCVVFGD